MWEACEAIRNILIELGPSIDGGKDSLSMAAKVLFNINNNIIIIIIMKLIIIKKIYYRLVMKL